MNLIDSHPRYLHYSEKDLQKYQSPLATVSRFKRAPVKRLRKFSLIVITVFDDLVLLSMLD
jgi:hypothetical protein